MLPDREILYKGTLNTSLVCIAEVFRGAIRRNCVAIVVARTRKLVEAGELMDVQDALGRLLWTVDGIAFDSQTEARRYTVLRNREAAGLVLDLVLQPSFELQEAFTDGGRRRYRAITSTADIGYTQDGRTVVEEVKSHAARDSSLRMRMFLYRHRRWCTGW